MKTSIVFTLFATVSAVTAIPHAAKIIDGYPIKREKTSDSGEHQLHRRIAGAAAHAACMQNCYAEWGFLYVNDPEGLEAHCIIWCSPELNAAHR